MSKNSKQRDTYGLRIKPRRRWYLISLLYTFGGFFILLLNVTEGLWIEMLLTTFLGLSILLITAFIFVQAFTLWKFSRASFSRQKALVKALKTQPTLKREPPRIVLIILLVIVMSVFWFMGIAELFGYNF